MNTYDVKIIVTLSETVKVKAESADESEEIARRMHKSCEVVLGAENHVDTDFIVTGSSEKLTNGLCACGNNEFFIEEVSDGTVLVTFVDGEMTAVQGSRRVDSIVYRGLFRCKACGKSYENEKK